MLYPIYSLGVSVGTFVGQSSTVSVFHNSTINMVNFTLGVSDCGKDRGRCWTSPEQQHCIRWLPVHCTETTARGCRYGDLDLLWLGLDLTGVSLWTKAAKNVTCKCYPPLYCMLDDAEGIRSSQAPHTHTQSQ